MFGDVKPFSGLVQILILTVFVVYHQQLLSPLMWPDWPTKSMQATLELVPTSTLAWQLLLLPQQMHVFPTLHAHRSRWQRGKGISLPKKQHAGVFPTLALGCKVRHMMFA